MRWMTLLVMAGACAAGHDASVGDSAAPDLAVPFVRFVSEDSLRQVEYHRTEFHADDEARKASLLAFVYDVPYLGCGFLPPRHLLNAYLRTGGSDGGMSPGATWAPFELTQREYAQLVAAVRAVPPESLTGRARYADRRLRFDTLFSARTDYFEWLEAVCRKPRP